MKLREYNPNHVICNAFKSCPDAVDCGGAEPHYPDNECNNCPINPSAECVHFTIEVKLFEKI